MAEGDGRDLDHIADTVPPSNLPLWACGAQEGRIGWIGGSKSGGGEGESRVTCRIVNCGQRAGRRSLLNFNRVVRDNDLLLIYQTLYRLPAGRGGTLCSIPFAEVPTVWSDPVRLT